MLDLILFVTLGVISAFVFIYFVKKFIVCKRSLSTLSCILSFIVGIIYYYAVVTSFIYVGVYSQLFIADFLVYNFSITGRMYVYMAIIFIFLLCPLVFVNKFPKNRAFLQSATYAAAMSGAVMMGYPIVRRVIVLLYNE